MTDFIDTALGDTPLETAVVPWVVHGDGSVWAEHLLDAIFCALPVEHPWKLAIRRATDETIACELEFATSRNLFSPTIHPLSVYQGASGWYLYCGKWSGPEALLSIQKRADTYSLAPLAVLSVSSSADAAQAQKAIQACGVRGLVILVDVQMATRQGLNGAVETALGSILGHVWLKVPCCNGNLSQAFGIRQARGVYTVGVGIDRPDLQHHATLWGRSLQSALADAMLSGEPTSVTVSPGPSWPVTFSTLLDPSSFAASAEAPLKSATDIPDLQIVWPAPSGGALTVSYHGRPVLRPVEDGGSVRAWLSKILGLRELESFLAVFGMDATAGFARLRAVRTVPAFSSKVREAATLPDAPAGLFAALERNLKNWIRFGAAGSKGTIHEHSPSQTLSTLIRQIEQQVMRQPSVAAVAIRMALIMLTGTWIILGPVIWKLGAVFHRGSPAFLGGICMAIGLAVVITLTGVWFWYTTRRPFSYYERAVDNIETRHLHKAMRAVLDRLGILAGRIEGDAKALAAKLEQALVTFEQKARSPVDAPAAPNGNRRFPAEKLDNLRTEAQGTLTKNAFIRFRNQNGHGLLADGEPWKMWFDDLGICTRDTAVQHLESLGYDEFARVASLTLGQRNAVLADIKAQSAQGLWLGARDPNARPWLLIPPAWGDLAEVQACRSQMLERKLPIVAAMSLIELPMTGLGDGEDTP